MKRLIGPLLAALVPCAALAATVAVAPSAATAATGTTTPSWSTLEQTALGVTSAYRDQGPLAVVGTPSPVSTSTVTTPSGPVSVAQRSVVATDGSGTVVLTLALLGGHQLVVNEMSPAAGYAGETLVLRSGTSTITGAFPLHGAEGSDATTAARSTRHHRGTAASEAIVSTTTGARANARLVTVGGCFANPQVPGVIGSDYGPLIQGEGVITCSTSESLSEIVSLYRGNTHVGNTGTGSDSGTFLGINSYDSCSVISGTHSFHTAELWSVNGILQGGATSGNANLHCT